MILFCVLLLLFNLFSLTKPLIAIKNVSKCTEWWYTFFSATPKSWNILFKYIKLLSELFNVLVINMVIVQCFESFMIHVQYFLIWEGFFRCGSWQDVLWLTFEISVSHIRCSLKKGNIVIFQETVSKIRLSCSAYKFLHFIFIESK